MTMSFTSADEHGSLVRMILLTTATETGASRG